MAKDKTQKPPYLYVFSHHTPPMKGGTGAGILEEVIPYAPSGLFMPAELGIEISLVPRLLLMKGLGTRLRGDVKYGIQ